MKISEMPTRMFRDIPYPSLPMVQYSDPDAFISSSADVLAVISAITSGDQDIMSLCGALTEILREVPDIDVSEMSSDSRVLPMAMEMSRLLDSVWYPMECVTSEMIELSNRKLPIWRVSNYMGNVWKSLHALGVETIASREEDEVTAICAGKTMREVADDPAICAAISKITDRSTLAYEALGGASMAEAIGKFMSTRQQATAPGFR